MPDILAQTLPVLCQRFSPNTLGRASVTRADRLSTQAFVARHNFAWPHVRATLRLALALALAASAVFHIESAADSAPSPQAYARLLREPLHLGAHRGGRDLWPENTLEAFKAAAAEWPGVLLEGDVQLSKDGHVVLMHDRTLDRTTNGAGPLKDKTLAELQALDAAYKFTQDRGETFPLRGTGVRIPLFRDVLQAAPNHRFLIEIKDGAGAAEAVIAIIRELNAQDRVILASFLPHYMKTIRDTAPEIATCYDIPGALAMLKLLREGGWESYQPECFMLTVPEGAARQYNLTPAEISAIQAKGIVYQVNTINREEDLRAYLDAGVDSILTDRPDILARLLQERGTLAP